MTKNSKETVLTAGYILLGLAGAVLAGYLTVGGVVFSHGSILLRYAVVGFSGALVYAAARLRGFGFCILMIVLMFFGQVAMNPPLRASSAVIAALWALPVGIAFTASGFIFKALRRYPIGKFILMGLLVGIGYAIGMVAYLLKVNAPVAMASVMKQAVAGIKVGALMGFGMEMVDLLGKALRASGESYYEE